jgi:hypothetical protein
MLVVSNTGIVEDFYLHDAIPLTLSPDNGLSFAVNDELFIRSGPIPALADDISTIMRRRAINNSYALDINANIDLAQTTGQTNLLRAWQWLGDAGPNASLDSHKGVLSLLSGSPSVVQPRDRDNILSTFKSVYDSPERRKGIRMCGWWNTLANADAEKENFENGMRSLEDQGDYERAAALAIFHLDLPRALAALTLGAKQPGVENAHLGLIALALNGFSYSLQSAEAGSERKSAHELWSKTGASSVESHIRSPYLQGAFAFIGTNTASLTGKTGNIGTSFSFRSILFQEGVELRERVAFACRFLPDAELNTYIRECADLAMEKGSLDALLLTGLGEQGIELIQNFMSATSDVQTAALLACHIEAYFPDLPKLDTQRWIISYRELLTVWRLWHARAKFDIARAKLLKTAQAATSGSASTEDVDLVPPQVFIRCNFCGQSLARPGMHPAGDKRFGGRLTRPGGKRLALSTTRIRGCPACKKPLPRCALCLEPFDCSTPAPGSGSKKPRGAKHHSSDSESPLDQSSTNPFDKWFTWCQTCRHGGHAHHISEWFAHHGKCPVVDCVCYCKDLDNKHGLVHAEEVVQEEPASATGDLQSPAPLSLPTPVMSPVAVAQPDPVVDLTDKKALQQFITQLGDLQQRLDLVTMQQASQQQLHQQQNMQQRQRQQRALLVAAKHNSYSNLHGLHSERTASNASNIGTGRARSPNSAQIVTDGSMLVNSFSPFPSNSPDVSLSPRISNQRPQSEEASESLGAARPVDLSRSTSQ